MLTIFRWNLVLFTMFTSKDRQYLNDSTMQTPNKKSFLIALNHCIYHLELKLDLLVYAMNILALLIQFYLAYSSKFLPIELQMLIVSLKVYNFFPTKQLENKTSFIIDICIVDTLHTISIICSVIFPCHLRHYYPSVRCHHIDNTHKTLMYSMMVVRLI